jgi:hypothetical protein
MTWARKTFQFEFGTRLPDESSDDDVAGMNKLDFLLVIFKENLLYG